MQYPNNPNPVTGGAPSVGGQIGIQVGQLAANPDPMGVNKYIGVAGDGHTPAAMTGIGMTSGGFFPPGRSGRSG